jgi:hypothetical protein
MDLEPVLDHMDSEAVLESRVKKRKRCHIQGCQKSAQGKTDQCIAHGGGRRCLVQGCQKSAAGKTDKCVEHGGGRRCLVQGCQKSAQGCTDKCVEHGGGRRCLVQGCQKSAAGKTYKCVDDEGPPLEERLERLHAEILRHIGRLERGENSAFLEVWYLYYPEGTEDYCGEAIAPEGL